MKKNTIICLVTLSSVLNAQDIPKEYFDKVKMADSLYEAKNYKQSALKYSEAFKINGWKALRNDRYNAACSWALANVPDSSFFNLERIANLSNYQNYNHISSDADLITLHNDKRWSSLLEKVKLNKEKAEANLNKPLVAKLDSIYNDDQPLRIEINEIEKKYGRESIEMKNHWKMIKEKDSINLIKVTSILDTYGWLGPDVIGNQGNTTLFLVIQHADLRIQEKYLPMMKDAVKSGKANASNLALLEDRIENRNGRKQIYGSQIGYNPSTKIYYVLPLIDPDNVDKRRNEVGLKSLSEYVKNWGITWDAEQYKKDLPELEKLQKKY